MESSAKKILIVEDNKEVLILNQKVLERNGFCVLTARTVAEARELMIRKPVDLIVLDILLPDGSGLDFCSEIRKRSTAPILMLSSLRSPQHIIDGLMTGGDDYMTKPYRVQELVARIISLLRRELLHQQQIKENASRSVIERGPLRLDTVLGRVRLNNLDIIVTPKEFAVLLLLVQNEGAVVSGKEIYEKIWGLSSNDDTRTVWVHISNLRSKLHIDGDSDISIATERGKGYLFMFTGH